MRRSARPFALLFVIAMSIAWNDLPGASEGAGDGATIVGTVPLPESPSPTVMAKRYKIVSSGGVLSTIPPVGVVWLEGDFPPGVEHHTVQIVQKNYLFDPALLAIRVGTTIEFPNEDEEYHNVFSYSRPKRFDLGRYLPEERPIPSQVFDKAGMVTLRCDIHEHMRAIILVIDSPYFVTTDTTGRFRLENLPEGDFILKAWLNSRQTLELPVSLSKGTALEVEFPDN